MREIPTSGGMAILHMATPAVPPAIMIAPRLSWEGSDPAGVKAFLATSYAAKYLSTKYKINNRRDEQVRGPCDSRGTPRPVSRKRGTSPAEDAAQAALAIQHPHDVPDAGILFFVSTLALDL